MSEFDPLKRYQQLGTILIQFIEKYQNIYQDVYLTIEICVRWLIVEYTKYRFHTYCSVAFRLSKLALFYKEQHKCFHIKVLKII